MRGIRGPLFGLIAVALTAAFILAGCGGSEGGGGESPAAMAPQSAPVYLELDVARSPKEGEELDALAREVLGGESAREFLATQLEQLALGSGEKLDFKTEVEPWLGERAGLYLAHDRGAAFNGFGLALETTNAVEAEEFIKGRQGAGSGKGAKAEFQGHVYYVDPKDESILGVLGDYVVFGETKANFEEMVKVSEGDESLAESSKFTSAMEAVQDQGVAHAYIDFGALIDQAEGTGSLASELALDLFGDEAHEATAVVTAIPHSQQIELDISTNATGAAAPGSGASTLLESLPATATAAFSSAEFGARLTELVDRLDKNGVPGQFKPGQIKLALGAVGINIDAIAESIGDVGGFVEGSGQSDLGGALLVETDSADETKKTIANLGRLVRLTGVPGVTAISGELSGFSIRSTRLGSQPLIVGAAGEKIVIAYGAKAAARALAKQTKTLGATADFEAAKKALGSTPISAFVAGESALAAVAELVPSQEQLGSGAAKSLLQKVSYVGAGSEQQDGETVTRVIIGVQK
jgi:uncharacterized protein DUF3352